MDGNINISRKIFDIFQIDPSAEVIAYGSHQSETCQNLEPDTLKDYSACDQASRLSLNTRDSSCAFTHQPKSNQGLDQDKRLTESQTK